MADNASIPKLSYNVYMPDGPEALCDSFDLAELAEVQDLIPEIRRTWRCVKDLYDDEIILLKCGELPMVPPDDTLYDCAIEWLRNNLNKAVRVPMIPALRLSEYFPSGPAAYEDKKIDIVVVTDAILNSISSLAAKPSLQSHDGSNLQTEPTFHLKVSFKDGNPRDAVPRWNSVLDAENNYVVGDDIFMPEFIQKAVERKRRVPNFYTELLTVLATKFFESTPGADNIVGKLWSSEADADEYADGIPEIIHYIEALNINPKEIHVSNEVYYTVLYKFRHYWMDQIQGSGCIFNKNFPFPLIALTKRDNNEDVIQRKYQPRPDVAFMKHEMPCFLAEIDSHCNGQDQKRLYVQMACTLRLALGFREDEMKKKNQEKDNDFFLMGAYFTDWQIHRYFCYANDDDKICFIEKVFEMKKPDDLTTFLFEFYNFARHVRDNDTLGNKKADLHILKDLINKRYPDDLDWSKNSEKPRTEASQDSADPGQNHGSNTDKHAAMIDALETSGYVVLVWDDCELQPLYDLPDHVVEARAPGGEGVIAKLCRKDSDELSLLRKLSSQKSPHNHVIPLLDTVQSSLGPLIILPQATLLSSNQSPYLFHHGLKGKLVQLSHELVEGVAFLHRWKIAHLDIKTDNLVYSFKSERLYIIDFDLAVQCKDVEETVELSCGTRGWSAPEVVLDDDKALRAFNPIRADLWSCGNVLRFFARVADKDENDRDIELLTDLLMDSEPGRRPLLHEVVDEKPDFWTSGRLHRTLESRELKGTMLKRTRGDYASHASQEGPAKKVLKN